MTDVDNHHAFKVASYVAFMMSLNHISLYYLCCKQVQIISLNVIFFHIKSFLSIHVSNTCVHTLLFPIRICNQFCALFLQTNSILYLCLHSFINFLLVCANNCVLIFYLCFWLYPWAEIDKRFTCIQRRGEWQASIVLVGINYEGLHAVPKCSAYQRCVKVEKV